jgi:hypothetical protein
MDKSRGATDGTPEAAVAEAWQQVGASFERSERVNDFDTAGFGI